MADPYVGEITTFAFDFAPRSWTSCDGATLSIARNTALFALLGTRFGGDGKTMFMLPDLRGRTPVGRGTTRSGVEIEQGTAGSFVSAEPSAEVDERSAGTLGLNFCIAVQGVFPMRS